MNKKIFEGQWINYIVSLVLALTIASILIIIQGSNPIDAFSAILTGSFGSPSAIASSIRWSTPVLIATMAAIIAGKSGIINLGLEGQIYFAALSAGIVSALIPLPNHLHALFAILVGGIVGLIYAIVPALLKAYLKVNEMIVTLMMNYIAVFMTEFITMKLTGMSADTNPLQIATPEILGSARLIKIMPPYQASTGIFIAVFIVLLVYLFFKHTRIGYEWTQMGKNPRFARFGGVNEKKGLILAFLVSGFIAGICGAVEITGVHYRFRNNFASNLGWDGIMVALIAKNNPIGALFVGVIWGMIKAGSLNMERATSVNRIIVTLVQALFVLFVTVDIRSIIKKYVDKHRKIEKMEGESI